MDPGKAVRREAPIRLADLSDEAHRATAEGDNGRVVEIEEEIDELAAGSCAISQTKNLLASSAAWRSFSSAAHGEQ